MMEFHISRNARQRYQFAESLFSYSGNVVFANLPACREFAHRMNTVREADKHPELAVHAGQLYAMGLIDEASHVLMARYREQFDPQVMTGALEWFSGIVGAEALGKMLLTFVEDFPGISVMRGDKTPVEWLAGETDGTSHWAVAFEELMLLWTANRNEAFQPFEELFEEKSLAEKTVYRQVTKQLPEYFATRPLIPVPDAKPMNLLDLLRAPALGAPRSLADQLAIIRKLWRPLIGDSLEHLLAIAAEILHEEELAIWTQFNPLGAGEQRRRGDIHGIVATAEVPQFGDQAHEYEKFSPDQAWMPTAVLIAKSTYVWLAQMSRQYGRWIKRLDEIPNEELETLAQRGLNTLWLIGVWERSRASKTIKQLCGNSDAVASAYSLFDYAIAEDLGGEAAYVNLRDRAYKYGIRLASDMVPNHMGIDSPWVIEHPDWFIARPEPPYPAYSFNGPDLSHDGRVEIKIEDHYFDQSDAAVVFRRRDRSSGETRYIYHGNDGTSFPWNDTAQLDYLNPAVREHVIQTILHVARLFPVIRFDAAMTLAKRHFHRLWFPGPGTSGAIPSRAEYGMSQAEFDRAMPHEFWREVVDRVAAEVPGTLLLAEAFWLMEGYFVRTLGMHRVYNSAFMVMLRDEDNAKYRSVIKNTLEFDPDIMKRYVNFMSNPDERTAIDQFGKGDKCFGVTAMMATLPGLPMFGHGQIEGFTEKYGMEYQRPRYEENADPWMVERHEREIAPLLKRRRLFAESGSFLLYDFFTDSGKVDENVFAYSNRSGNERALVVFNNRYGETHGTIDYSAAYADKGANQLRQQRIGEGLGVGGNSEAVLAWRDSLTGLEYLRRASDLSQRGLTLDLHAYQCHVFLDWCELYSTQEKPWDRLSDQLNGRGVPSLEDALVNLELQPVHDALRAMLDTSAVRLFADLAEHPRTLAVGINTKIEVERSAFFSQAWMRCENFMRAAQKAYLALAGGPGKLAGDLPANPGLLGAAFRARLRSAMRIPAIESLFPAPWSTAARRVLPSPSPQLTATAMWGPVLGWCVLELLAESFDAEKPEPIALDLFDRLRLREPFAQVFAALGFEGEEAWRVAARVKVGLLVEAGAGNKAEAVPAKATDDTTTADTSEVSGRDLSVADSAFSSPRDSGEEEQPPISPALWLDPDVRWLTGVHSTEGHAYLVHEPYEELLWWLLMPSLLRLASETGPGRIPASRAAVEVMSRTIKGALATAEAAGYRVDLLMAPAGIEEATPETTPAADADAGGVAKTETKPEPSAEVVPAEDLKQDSAESVDEALVEAVAEPKWLAEAEPVGAEELKPAEQQIEAAADFAAEPETEVQPELDVSATADSAVAAKLELVERKLESPVEPYMESVAETEIEPAEPLSAARQYPVELESEAAVDLAIEPSAEAELEPELAAEPESLLVEGLEPVSDVAAEDAVEVGIAAGTQSEAEQAASKEQGPLQLESEAATEGAIETVTELSENTETEAETEPESLVQTEPISVEKLESGEPESELAMEVTPGSAQETGPEPELLIQAEPLPDEESEPESEVTFDLANERFAKTENGPELPVRVEPLPAQALEPANPESEADGKSVIEPSAVASVITAEGPFTESGFEAEVEIETPEEIEPAPAEDREPVKPGTEAVVEPVSGTRSEPAFETVDETELAPESESEADPLRVEELEPIEPVIDSTEPTAAVNPQPMRIEWWEPTMPRIEFASKSAIEPKVAMEVPRSLTEPWEPPAPKIDFVAKHAADAGIDPDAPEIDSGSKPTAEFKTFAEVLHLLNERWEPPVPKVEFVAKSTDELKAELEKQASETDSPESPEPETDKPQE